MALHEQIDLPAFCGSIQDLTNSDFCGTDVLASYTAGVILVYLHQAGFAILDCMSKNRSKLTHRTSQLSSIGKFSQTKLEQNNASDTKRWQFEPSLEASSISLFDTAIVLAASWQIAALLSLNSTLSVQTTHDVLLVCLTAYASIAIALGALCTSFDHIRRHRYRFLSSVVTLLLCAPVTGMGQQAIMKDDFPKEICLPFFIDYKHTMRRCFVVLSVVFWVISIIMVTIMCFSLRSTGLDAAGKRTEKTHPRLLRSLSTLKIYVLVVLELALLVTIVLVSHYFVPEQVLRAQAGGQLAESQWTFGQIVGMLIWLPVVSEFLFVFRFGPKEGLEGRLPTTYTVRSKVTDVSAIDLTDRTSAAKRFGRVGTEQFYEVI